MGLVQREAWEEQVKLEQLEQPAPLVPRARPVRRVQLGPLGQPELEGPDHLAELGALEQPAAAGPREALVPPVLSAPLVPLVELVLVA